MPPVLTTERLLLRLFRLPDFEDVLRYGRDPQLAAFYPRPHE